MISIFITSLLHVCVTVDRVTPMLSLLSIQKDIMIVTLLLCMVTSHSISFGDMVLYTYEKAFIFMS